MFENIRISFQGIWSHKLRSLLTMLGIIIGIAAIISIVSTIKGTNETIKKNLIGSGTNTVTVQYGESPEYPYEIEYQGMPKGVPVYDDTMNEQLMEIANVVNVSKYLIRSNFSGIYYEGTSLSSPKLIGGDINYLNTCGYIMTQGRRFSKSDFEKYRKVAVVDKTVVSSLFRNKSPIGKTIEIKGEPFIIIGVVDESVKFEPNIHSVEEYYEYAYDSADSGGTVIIPDVDWGMMIAYDEPYNFKLLATSTDEMQKVGKAAQEKLNESVTSKEVKYYAKDISKTAEENEQLSSTANKQLIWIASISLLVGGIGVMNIMLVSVTERTKEIGLKKAIGARKNRILSQFLTEAAVLTSLGGIIGTIAGITMAEIISKISDVPVAISIPAVIIAILFSMMIGVVFGFIPAVKAANLDPIVALRHE